MKESRTSILEAVSAAIAFDTTFNTLYTGGIWTGEIPEGSINTPREMPYASLEIDSTDFTYTSGNKDLERTTFSIVVFHTGGKLLDDILDQTQAFLSSFDYTNSFTNNDTIEYLFPSRRTTRSEFARDKKGNQIFTGTLMFEAGLWRH